MEEARKQFIAIDLKSFYASVECAERGLDPLDANLVVADESRTDKTICLAVSPSLKQLGIPGRPRLFEAKQRIREVNSARRAQAPGHAFRGKSISGAALAADPSLEIDLVIAPPRMAYYMDYSRRVVEIYLRYVSPEDLLVYSVDEVFIDVTHYLRTYKTDAHTLAVKMIREVLRETGITATAGIGTNLYLAKVAMDIVAKHMPADRDGVRIAELNERSFREQLWCHTPLTDFWRIGPGIARKLERNGLQTMGDIARCSVGKPSDYYNEEFLYHLFGVNAELLIDHAWGYEPTEIADCKAYTPESRSLSSGQVLAKPYPADKGKLIVKEMTDLLATDLVRKRLMTDQLVLDVCYDIENLRQGDTAAAYHGEIQADHYGRLAPKSAHGSVNLGRHACVSSVLLPAIEALYDRIVNPALTVRRVNITAEHLLTIEQVRDAAPQYEQLNLFTDYEAQAIARARLTAQEEKERRMQAAIIGIRDKYGKNAILRGMNLLDGATTVERNRQVGGHKA
ncbi:MAG: DNA methylase [Clostridia bacterium]|nr:DNA methylase [Clostridia bacterium]